MEDTNTYITWPNKLKLGAKSKKDPHVRIAGKPEDVKTAKDRIMSILYTRVSFLKKLLARLKHPR